MGPPLRAFTCACVRYKPQQSNSSDALIALYAMFCISRHSQARLYEVEHEGRPITVRRASKLLANNIARCVAPRN